MNLLRKLTGCMIVLLLTILAAGYFPQYSPVVHMCMRDADNHCHLTGWVHLAVLASALGCFAIAYLTRRHPRMSTMLLISAAILLGLFVRWDILNNSASFMAVQWTLLFVLYLGPVWVVFTFAWTLGTLLIASLRRSVFWLLLMVWIMASFVLPVVFVSYPMPEHPGGIWLVMGVAVAISYAATTVWTVLSMLYLLLRIRTKSEPVK